MEGVGKGVVRPPHTKNMPKGVLEGAEYESGIGFKIRPIETFLNPKRPHGLRANSKIRNVRLGLCCAHNETTAHKPLGPPQPTGAHSSG